ncbi:mRNA capping enzyme (macronuclear) [Tetrahymena thermophila SB210]|uniref:Snurportin-1 n=1 Tax=Tetrahymena thermophila (strain SB210) TaxID=312017 RepID=I7LTQ5_TETTS|nr:mRNA capping enzyme [Tetrahymena thermophila SB210]EAR85666.1 mRNA capping enzyme [Tetrahymena thermophila SB210]|eukprot:XP_001033329.1 mRNA capping enzyme [Tetrahymena thermophila SB210]
MMQMDKNREVIDDHNQFLERKRQLFNLYQQRNRNRILKKSRQLFRLISEQQKLEQKNEEQELEDLIDAMDIEANNIKQNESNNKTDEINQNLQNNPVINEEPNSRDDQKFENQGNFFAQPQLSKSQQRKLERERNKQEQNQKLAQQYRKEIQSLMVQPQYMIEIPDDIGPNYFVMPRPTGKRCLVITQNQFTTSRDKNGILIHNFQSILPGGSKLGEKSKFYSILDCIFNEEQQTYYIMDVIIYKDLNMAENSTDMRFFWIQQKFSQNEFQDISDCNQFKFKIVPKQICTRSSFKEVYQCKFDFQKDGILFIHKDTDYKGGIHPNFLFWKDTNFENSPFKKIPLSITSSEQNALPKVTAHLICDENYCLGTLDNYILYQLSSEERKIYGVQPYMIVKVEISTIKLTPFQTQLLQEFESYPHEIEPQKKDSNAIEEEIKLKKNWVFVEDLNIIEVIDPNQIYASANNKDSSSQQINEEVDNLNLCPDSLSQLVFEYKLITNPISFSQICERIDIELESSDEQ